MQTMYPALVNSPATALSSAITATDATIHIVDGNKLPPAPNIATIGNGESAETVLYTGKNGNTLTGVTRGFQGMAQAWGSGVQIARYFTAYDYSAMKTNIEEQAAQLAENDVRNVTLQPGMKIIKADRKTPVDVLSVKGRTLVNLLGRDGNCEDISKLYYIGGTAALDNTRKTSGSNSVKVTKTATSTYVNARIGKYIYPKVGDCYIALADVYLENTAINSFITTIESGVNRLAKYVTDTSIGTFPAVTTGKFVPIIAAYQITAVTTIGESYMYPRVYNNGTIGHNFNVDNFRIFKITQAEYDALGVSVDLATAQAIAAKYPYVDGAKGVEGPYLMRYASDGTTVEDRILYEGTFYGANQTDTDEIIYQNGQAKKVKRFETTELDGSKGWDFSSRDPNSKTFFFPPIDNIALSSLVSNEIVEKWNGDLLKNFYRNRNSWSDDVYNISSASRFLIQISNNETGFGASYIPTPNEIKAYFNGWQAKAVDSNGKPTAWKSLVDGTDAPTQTLTYVSKTKASGYTPYRLIYQLAEPEISSIISEGAISLDEGDNSIELGSGAKFDQSTWSITKGGVLPASADISYRTKLGSVVEGVVERLTNDETQISMNTNAVISILARLKAGGL